ncbi:MAG TPA: FlgD immunoglobulin-like domain containing protein [Candidatus Krumholzibacteria bacterium]|nr:FlgD immunoglobulin-like domain containing protein [Candidatus Krumholzibacteria bacterium]HPD71888.1 FlgD immunoglobulin-like domain containing protein [Candidatus Krumholzibacteria bacterium]HRY41179.1 FlgD immunoglobulin-like domain containing protein [Candidatus Krumholzibacteria bacterium]
MYVCRHRSAVIAPGLALAVGLSAPLVALASIHDYSPPPAPGETYGVADFRLFVPDDAAVVRGVLCRIAPHLADSRPEVGDPALQQLCAGEDFALLGARLDDVGMETGIGDALLRTLAAFAAESGHPELAFTTCYFEGYSWGGQFAYHFTVWRPDRVIGFVTMKGGFHRTDPAGDAILVPGYLFIGENDLPYRIENLTAIFEAHRPLGARWALAVQPGAAHEPVTDRGLLDGYFQTVSRLRLPEAIPPGEVPALATIPEPDSWLGDRARLVIGSWDCYDAAADSASWLPSRDTAGDWQTFVTAGAMNDTISCATPVAAAPRAAIRLLPNRPNPFNPATEIAFALPGEAGASRHAVLQIVDARGRLVRTLVDGALAAGWHRVTWDGRDGAGRVVTAGMYVYRVTTIGQSAAGKMVLLK